MAGRRPHHHPPLQAINHAGTQFLQASDFSGDVVGFNVYMDPALMLDTLNLHDRLVEWCLQHTVGAASAWMIEVQRATQCVSPKPGSLIDISCIAVDE
jgi:hypothetical protein